MATITIEQLAAAAIVKPATEQAETRFTEHNIGQIMRPIPPIDYILAGVIDAGSVTVIAGDGGGGKTWLAMALMAAVAKQSLFLGRQTSNGGGCCVWWDCDTSLASVRRRAQMLFDATATNTYFYSDAINITTDTDAIISAIGRRKTALLVLDTLAASAGAADENDAAKTTAYMQQIRRIAAVCKCAIIIIHHTNKSGGTRGSTAIANSADNVFLLANNNGVRKLSALKCREFERPPDLFLEYHWQPDANGQTFFGITLLNDVIEPAQPATKAEQARYAIEQWRGNNPGGTYRQMLADLVSASLPESTLRVIWYAKK